MSAGALRALSLPSAGLNRFRFNGFMARAKSQPSGHPEVT